MNNFELNAKDLRVIAQETIVKKNHLYDIKKKIYDEAVKGQAYLKTGFLSSLYKDLDNYCVNHDLKLKNIGNDGSGSDYTTIIIDWSVKGDGILRLEDK